jgi:hypothetical protein
MTDALDDLAALGLSGPDTAPKAHDFDGKADTGASTVETDFLQSVSQSGSQPDAQPDSPASDPDDGFAALGGSDFEEPETPSAAPATPVAPAAAAAAAATPAPAPVTKKEGMNVSMKAIYAAVGVIFAAGAAGVYYFSNVSNPAPQMPPQTQVMGQQMPQAPVSMETAQAPGMYDQNMQAVPNAAAYPGQVPVQYDPTTGLPIQPQPAVVYDAMGNPVPVAPQYGQPDPYAAAPGAMQPVDPANPVNASIQPGAIGTPVTYDEIPAAPAGVPGHPEQFPSQQIANSGIHAQQVAQPIAQPAPVTPAPAGNVTTADLEARVATLESQLKMVLERVDKFEAAKAAFSQAAKPQTVKPVVRSAPVAKKPTTPKIEIASEYEPTPYQPATPKAAPAPTEYESFDAPARQSVKVAAATPIPTVQAVLPGRAWLLNESSGEVTSVELGNNVAGCGKVVAIDANSGEVIAGKCRMKF